MTDSSDHPPPPASARRRELHFQSLHEVLADVETLMKGPVVALGRWSSGQILMHLARSIDLSIDGAPSSPWYVRLVGRHFLKRRFLSQAMPPGWKMPVATLLPGETTPEAGLKALRGAIQRFAANPSRQPHPVFGPLTCEEWEAFHCRHAELHLSFLAPGSEPKMSG